MFLKFTLTSNRAKEKVIDFIGEANIVRTAPVCEGLDKFNIDIIVSDLIISNDNNSIILCKAFSGETMILAPTEYLMLKIF